MSPLQYQKRIRLLKARTLLVVGGKSVTTAAFKVGYERATQFSREYARAFGLAPGRDSEQILARDRPAVDKTDLQQCAAGRQSIARVDSRGRHRQNADV